MRVRPLLVLAAVLAALLAPGAHAAKRVPAGFFGVVADGPLFDPAVELEDELGVMSRSGVQAVRFAIYWDDTQPYATFDEVPEPFRQAFADEGGVPTYWTRIDGIVALAAAKGLRVLPVVLRAPAWARKHPDKQNSPPSAEGVDAYARFAAALVRRYGADGAFWAANPQLRKLPVRQWQVWNEPGGVRDWSDQPGVPAYVRLLERAHAAIKAADPTAQVVLAGLVGRSWEELAQVYRRGGRGSFDAVAVHPFTNEVRHVMRILRNNRKVMRRFGDGRMPMHVTELSWPSAKGKTSQVYGFEQTEQGQAQRLRQGLKAILADRKPLRIASVFWSSWLSYDRDERYSFDYAGLRKLKGGKVVAKPAFRAFRKLAVPLTR